MMRAYQKRWDFSWSLKIDSFSTERMCMGREFQVEGAKQKRPRGNVASDTVYKMHSQKS